MPFSKLHRRKINHTKYRSGNCSTFKKKQIQIQNSEIYWNAPVYPGHCYKSIDLALRQRCRRKVVYVGPESGRTGPTMRTSISSASQTYYRPAIQRAKAILQNLHYSAIRWHGPSTYRSMRWVPWNFVSALETSHLSDCTHFGGS
eukprot:COSAG02_NODE_4431_length_5366_cov_9.496298_5_plen_145_part_00